MERFRFEYLDKSRKDEWLPRLFDLLYNNMKDFVSGGMSYGEEREAFLSAVGPALEKEPRQIILMRRGETLAGYFQYYVNGGTFMVEEIQIVQEFQGTTLLAALFRYLSRELPEGIERIAAYAHKNNLHSQTIMGKLGMEPAGESDGDFCFYRGDFRPIARKFSVGK